MKIVLAGATGFIGRKLIEKLITDKHRIVILTRQPDKATQRFGPLVQAIQWDARSPGDWFASVDGADAVINLTGESIAGKRWNETQKHLIRSSRLESTRIIVRAIESASVRPSVLINASAVGYYGDVPEDTVTEHYPASTDFLGILSEQWEHEARHAEHLSVRVVCLRIGIVLGDGGALEKMVLPFKLFVGGPLGSGKQWFPWVHRDDVVRSIHYILDKESIEGPVNLTAPNPVRMNDFCKTLGKILRRPSWMAVPAFALRLAVGEFSQFLLTGQKAVPEKLLKNGYSFMYSDVEKALRNILIQ